MSLNQFPYTEAGWFLLLCAASVALGYHVIKRHNVFLGLFVGYILLRTAFVLIQSCPVGSCQELTISSSFVVLAAFVMFWLVERFDIGLLFFVLLPVNAVLTLVCLVFGLPSGLIGNPSMNGTFMVAALFFFSDRLSRAWKAVVLIAILAQSVMGSGTSIPIGMLAVGASVLIVCRYGKEAVLYVVSFLVAIVWFGLMAVPEFFNPWDRFSKWAVLFREWQKLDVAWFGSGGGTFWVYGPMIQHWAFGTPGKEIEIMRYMHSDWAQLYLEFGIVGVCLGVAAMASVLSTSSLSRFPQPYNHEAVAAIASLGAAAIFNWPMHCALTALFAVFLSTCQNRD